MLTRTARPLRPGRRYQRRAQSRRRLEEVGSPDLRRRAAVPAARVGRQRGRSAPERRVVILRSPAALRRLLWSPGELGLAQAYVTGELDVEGDLKTALESVWATVRARGLQRRFGSHRGWLAKAVRHRTRTRRDRPPAAGSGVAGAS